MSKLQSTVQYCQPSRSSNPTIHKINGYSCGGMSTCPENQIGYIWKQNQCDGGSGIELEMESRERIKNNVTRQVFDASVEAVDPVNNDCSDSVEMEPQEFGTSNADSQKWPSEIAERSTCSLESQQSSVRCRPLKTVLVALRIDSSDVIQSVCELVSWLIQEKRLSVYLDECITQDTLVVGHPRFAMLSDHVILFNAEKDDLTDKIDLVVCLGGDGTLLYASSLFPKSVPPVLAFHLGTVGLLSPLHFSSFKGTFARVTKDSGLQLMKRTRLDCVLSKHYRRDHVNNALQHQVHSLVLNEVVIDRGVTSFLCNLDIYIDGHLVTTVQGDGVMLSTPTGSTAYAAAAGSSMVHPSVPAILIIPICPHSLSFRPIIVPASVKVKVKLSPDARNDAWIAFDGNKRIQMCKGDCLTITTSPYSVPVVCTGHPVTDWFDNLAECLNWNVRKPQKPLSP